MKADKIIKNAHIFTADKNHPKATALVVKDGKFVYVLFWLFADALVRYLKIRAGRIASMKVEFVEDQ